MPLIGIAGLAGSGKDAVGKFIQELVPNAKRASFADPIKWFAGKVFDFSHEALYGPSELRNAPDPRYTSWGSSNHESPPWQLVHQRYSAYRLQFVMEYVARGIPGLGLDLTTVLSQLDCWFYLHIVRNEETLTPRHVLQTLGTEFGRMVHPDAWVNYLAKKTRGSDQWYYVTDVRFENEMKKITDDYDNALWWLIRPGAGLGGAAGDHVSESHLRSDALRERFATATYMNEGTLGDLQAWVQEQLNKMGVRDASR
jgi:hypothetical protein